MQMTQQMFEERLQQRHAASKNFAEAQAALTAADADGDISDNAAHDIAEQRVDRAKRELERIVTEIEDANILQTLPSTDSCHLFNYITVRDLSDSSVLEFQLVGKGQGAPPHRISIDCPLGAAVLGHKLMTHVEYTDGRMKRRIYEISRISNTPCQDNPAETTAVFGASQ